MTISACTPRDPGAVAALLDMPFPGYALRRAPGASGRSGEQLLASGAVLAALVLVGVALGGPRR